MTDFIRVADQTTTTAQAQPVENNLQAEAHQAMSRTSLVDRVAGNGVSQAGDTSTTNSPPDWSILGQPPILGTTPPSDSQPGTPAPAAPPADTGADDPTYKKIGRETEVFGLAAGESVLNGLANLPEKIPEISAGIASGAVLSSITKAGDLGLATAFVIGGYFASKWILNTYNDKERWKAMGGAVSDAWNSNQHIKQDINTVSKTGGDYAFDTGLSVASGYLGYKNKALGDLVLNVLHIPIVAPSVGIAPALLGMNMYLDVMPPLMHSAQFQDSPNGLDAPQQKTNVSFDLKGNVGWTTTMAPTLGQPVNAADKPATQK